MSTAPRRSNRVLIFVCALAFALAGGSGVFSDQTHSDTPPVLPTIATSPTPPSPQTIPTAPPTLPSPPAPPAPPTSTIPSSGAIIPDLRYPQSDPWDLGDALPPPNTLSQAGYATADAMAQVTPYYYRLLTHAGFGAPVVTQSTRDCATAPDCQVTTVSARTGEITITITITPAKMFRDIHQDTRDGRGNPWKPTYQSLIVYRVENAPRTNMPAPEPVAVLAPDLTYPNSSYLIHDRVDNQIVGSFATPDSFSTVADYYLRQLEGFGYVPDAKAHPIPESAAWIISTPCAPTTQCDVRHMHMVNQNVAVWITVFGAQFFSQKQGEVPDFLAKQRKPGQTLISYAIDPHISPVALPTSRPSIERSRAEEMFKTALAQQSITLPLVADAPLPNYTASFSVTPVTLTYINPEAAKRIQVMVMLPGSIDLTAQQNAPIFRGVRAFYQHNLHTGDQSLHWAEPGYDRTMAHITTTPYVLRTTGLDETEFWQIANSLTPAPRFGRSLGGASLGGSLKEVMGYLGAPIQKTAVHGNGSPEWHFANGIITYGETVWAIIAEAPFAGATAEGFRLGDTRETYNTLYHASVDTRLPRPPDDQIYVKDDLGTTLTIHFDAGGKATQIRIDQDSP